MDAIIKSSRPYGPTDYAMLKAATRHAVQQAGGVVNVAKHTRLDAATISRAGNPCHTNLLPLDVAADIDRMAGDTIILRSLALMAGSDVVPARPRKSSVDLGVLVGRVARDAGALVSDAINAEADGDLTPNEAMRIDKVRADLDRANVAVGRKLQGVVVGK